VRLNRVTKDPSERPIFHSRSEDPPLRYFRFPDSTSIAASALGSSSLLLKLDKIFGLLFEIWEGKKMHTLVVAPKTSKEATLAATQAMIDPMIDSMIDSMTDPMTDPMIGSAIVPTPKARKLSSRRVAYRRSSGLSLEAPCPC
jgi:hypothetical protein